MKKLKIFEGGPACRISDDLLCPWPGWFSKETFSFRMETILNAPGWCDNRHKAISRSNLTTPYANRPARILNQGAEQHSVCDNQRSCWTQSFSHEHHALSSQV